VSNPNKKLVREMRQSYEDARKRITDAMAECSPGTAVYLQYVKALADIDAQEREEAIKLGLTPANLGAATKPEFLFVSHTSATPANRTELQKLLTEQQIAACEGLDLSVDRPAFNGMCELAFELKDRGDTEGYNRVWELLQEAYKNDPNDKPDALDLARENEDEN